MTYRKRRNRLVEWGKNLLILLLTLSALSLLGRTQFANALFSRYGWLWDTAASWFRSDEDAAAPHRTDDSAPAVQPARLAICQDGQRCGVQYDSSAADAAFGELSTLLSEALSSAAAPEPVPEQTWRQALSQDGLYFDFSVPLPLSALSAWLGDGAVNPALPHDARRICLTGTADGGVSLLYHNEADGLYYACGTTLSREIHLEAALTGWSPNGATFAFEADGMDALDPYTMLPAPAEMPEFSASNPLSDDPERLNSLLRTLSFQPQGALDPAAGGQLREGSDTLRLTADGSVTFHSIGDSDFRFPLSAGRQETLDFVCRLAETTAGAWCGDARLVLAGIQETGNELQITFQYRLAGAPVALPDGRAAARFTVRNGAVTDFTLYLRAYAASEETTPVLPVLQAGAILEGQGTSGRELALRYLDAGGGPVRAGWTASQGITD